jgi:hypothetical protein
MIVQVKNKTVLFIISSVVCSFACTYFVYFLISFIIEVPFYSIFDYLAYAFWCALCLWQLAHIGLCIYFYATDNELPHFARIYLYVDMAIVSAVMLGLLVLLVNNAINNCKETVLEICLLIGLEFLGILASFWFVLGSNIMMAYCVLHLNTAKIYQAIPYKKN